MDEYLNPKNQHISIQSWHIPDLVLGNSYGMPKCAWPQPLSNHTLKIRHIAV